MTGKMPLSLALVALTALGGTASAEGWSFEVYGGLTAERTETWAGTRYDMDQGNLLGVGVYSDRFLPGYAVGLDAMGTRALYTGFPGEYIESLSVMAVLRRDFPLGQALEGYVAGGLGAIWNTYEDAGIDDTSVVPGAQIALGLRQNFGASSAIFAEIKHQAGLRDAYLEDNDLDQSYASTSLILGYSFGF